MDQEDFVETYGFSTDDLNQLLEQKQYRQLREKVNDLNEADTAEYLEELPDEKRLLVFRMLQKDKASDVFALRAIAGGPFGCGPRRGRPVLGRRRRTVSMR